MEINTLFAVKTTNCLQETRWRKRIKSNQLSVGTCNPAGITHGCRAGGGWTGTARRPCQTLFAQSWQWRAAAGHLLPQPSQPGRSDSPSAGNIHTSPVTGNRTMEPWKGPRISESNSSTGRHNFNNQDSTHLGQESWYCWALSPIPCTSSDTCVTPKTWHNQSTNN